MTHAWTKFFDQLLTVKLLKKIQKEIKDAIITAPKTPKERFLNQEMIQILSAQTPERAHHYIKRILAGLNTPKYAANTDLNLNTWKTEEDLITDSLWLINKRDTSETHKSWYWGNFVPQIPHQLIRRFTKPGDWVLDTFCGSGTTLIECRKLGRNGIGCELQPSVIKETRALLKNTQNPQKVSTTIVQGDSSKTTFTGILTEYGQSQVPLVICHPPYWDILKFSEDKADLSNAPTLSAFLEQMKTLFKNVAPVIRTGGHLAVIIGDKYEKKEWIPLGFYCMEEALKFPFKLKSVIVKNFDLTRGKLGQEALWRYRALANGFYVFKHEYIFLFQKKKEKTQAKTLR